MYNNILIFPFEQEPPCENPDKIQQIKFNKTISALHMEITELSVA
jgi:hypothetical protein